MGLAECQLRSGWAGPGPAEAEPGIWARHGHCHKQFYDLGSVAWPPRSVADFTLRRADPKVSRDLIIIIAVLTTVILAATI